MVSHRDKVLALYGLHPDLLGFCFFVFVGGSGEGEGGGVGERGFLRMWECLVHFLW